MKYRCFNEAALPKDVSSAAHSQVLICLIHYPFGFLSLAAGFPGTVLSKSMLADLGVSLRVGGAQALAALSGRSHSCLGKSSTAPPALLFFIRILHMSIFYRKKSSSTPMALVVFIPSLSSKHRFFFSSYTCIFITEVT